MCFASSPKDWFQKSYFYLRTTNLLTQPSWNWPQVPYYWCRNKKVTFWRCFSHVQWRKTFPVNHRYYQTTELINKEAQEKKCTGIPEPITQARKPILAGWAHKYYANPPNNSLRAITVRTTSNASLFFLWVSNGDAFEPHKYYTSHDANGYADNTTIPDALPVSCPQLFDGE